MAAVKVIGETAESAGNARLDAFSKYGMNPADAMNIRHAGVSFFNRQTPNLLRSRDGKPRVSRETAGLPLRKAMRLFVFEHGKVGMQTIHGLFGTDTRLKGMNRCADVKPKRQL